MSKVYVKSFCCRSFRDEIPDFRQYVSPVEARRMGPLMKSAIVSSHTALAGAGLECPQAVISATGYGCVASSEAILLSVVGLSDAPVKPTNFMQSTHNTVGSAIAIRLGCHGYNVTYSHRDVSFESALLDAYMKISTGALDNALVGAFEEMTPAFAVMLSKMGREPHSMDGSLMETAVSLVLSSDPAGAICELADVSLLRRCCPEKAAELENSPAGPGGTLIKREEYSKTYGSNFCCSAYGSVEALKLLENGGTGRVVVSNFTPDGAYARVTFDSLCGN